MVETREYFDCPKLDKTFLFKNTKKIETKLGESPKIRGYWTQVTLPVGFLS